ncbi:SDR family NAD(P)-dependent oxidoreductase [Halomonas mongoliensis]|uniref:SDR family NAD(P)-dependent oxidoreductase n=1 Tax=Halomonas mongoliensis TaxID=321265 RepID=UPI00403AD064
MPAKRRLILITGASGAIGGALADAYAEPGVELILQGRDPIALKMAAHRCTLRGAQVTLSRLDLAQPGALTSWLDSMVDEQLPNLVILAAGINLNTRAAEGEDPEPSQHLLALNLLTPIRIAQALAPRMKARGSGHLVFISSLAGWYGLPVTPSYSASKAGIKAYGEALRGWLAPHGVGVSVVMPGYVKSPMADGMLGPKPWVWSPQRAARVIRQGIQCNKARISFPFPLNLGSWCLAVMPAALSQRVVSWLGYGVKP